MPDFLSTNWGFGLITTLGWLAGNVFALRAWRTAFRQGAIKAVTAAAVSDETLNESVPQRRKYWLAREGELSWLEEVEGEKSLKWVQQQNDIAIKALGEPKKSPLFRDVLEILESKEKIPHVHKVGKLLYNTWHDEKFVRGLLRRCTEEEFEKENPSWETLIDFAELGKAEGESWVFKSYSVFYPDTYPAEEPRRVLLILSRGGSDASVIREYDVVNKAFVDPASPQQGFVLPEAKSYAAWLDRDTLLVGTDFKDGKSLTDSGYPRTVRVLRRGMDLYKDSVLQAECKQTDMLISASLYKHRGHKFQVRRTLLTFYTNECWLKVGSDSSEEGWRRVPKPNDADLSIFQDQLMLELRSDWVLASGTVLPAGALVSAPVADLMSGGDACSTFTVLFTPTPSTSLYSSCYTLNLAAIVVMEDVKTSVLLWRHEGKGVWKEHGSEPRAQIRGVSLSALDDEDGDSVWLSFSSFTQPSQLALVALDSGASALQSPAAIKSLPKQFDSSVGGGIVEEQHMAVSADGTKVPYFLVGRRDVLLSSAPAPTLLYGYGGFEISLPPAYAAVTGKAWLEKGGVYVSANIRGGGEYGPRWHKAALREKRHCSYDDFIAVAQDLVKRGVTVPAKLGIRGGSNGGLLMANMLVRAPHLFGAIVCQVPLVDMKRYSQLLAGASWVAEYGDPDKAQDWSFLQCYSAQHNIDPASVSSYPPLLVMTSTKDDRVHPYHARALVRRLLDVQQAEEERRGGTPSTGEGVEGSGAPRILYWENMEGGHGGAADLKQTAYMTTLYLDFLWARLA